MRSIYRVFVFFLVCGFISCGVMGKKQQLPQALSINELRLIDEYIVPHQFQYKGTMVGGLSGIDYDAVNKQYYLVCDDVSREDLARFYTAKISVTGKGIDTIEFINITTLLMPGGTAYPLEKTDQKEAPDLEAIRYNPIRKQLIVTSEGERVVRKDTAILKDPFVHSIKPNGKFEDSFALPQQIHMYATDKGARLNGTFEGVTFGKDYKSVYASMEEPTYDDGPRAGLGKDSSAWVRIVKYDESSRKPVAQYAYQIEPVAHPPPEPGAFKINGVTDVLSISEHKLMVVERSFSSGRPNNTIRIFEADFSEATDVGKLPSLKNAAFQPISKRLLLNMDDLNMQIDNIEGVCYGPILPNGNQTLIFVSDNNFDARQKTQILLFEIIP